MCSLEEVHHTNCSTQADHVRQKPCIEVDPNLAWSMPEGGRGVKLRNYDVMIGLGGHTRCQIGREERCRCLVRQYLRVLACQSSWPADLFLINPLEIPLQERRVTFDKISLPPSLSLPLSLFLTHTPFSPLTFYGDLQSLGNSDHYISSKHPEDVVEEQASEQEAANTHSIQGDELNGVHAESQANYVVQNPLLK